VRSLLLVPTVAGAAPSNEPFDQGEDPDDGIAPDRTSVLRRRSVDP
jgi:hypothetical protein